MTPLCCLVGCFIFFQHVCYAVHVTKSSCVLISQPPFTTVFQQTNAITAYLLVSLTPADLNAFSGVILISLAAF